MDARIPALCLATVVTAGCVSTYDISLMPRTSGKLFSGKLEQRGASEGVMTVTIEGVTYSGPVVEVSSSRNTSYVTSAIGPRRSWAWGGSGTIQVDASYFGGESKALLRSGDGKGLRCDLRDAGRTGGGTCRDDAGQEYDLQFRPAPRP